MKKLAHQTISLRKHALRTPALAALAALLAGSFWMATGSSGIAGAPMCTVCHKRSQTQQYPCNSLEYARHLDHGDPMGSCATPTVSERSRKIDPVRISPPDIAVN